MASRTARHHKSEGFTLLEMVISLGIFAVVVVASIGITLAIANAQTKAANLQAVQDNVRFGMELMTKEMRTGSEYQISSSFCPDQSGQGVSFLTEASARRMYYLSGTILMRVVGTNCAFAKPLIADEVVVERLRFKTGGAAPGAIDGQPWVMTSLSVRSSNPKQILESRMDLQTTVVRRFRDL